MDPVETQPSNNPNSFVEKENEKNRISPQEESCQNPAKSLPKSGEIPKDTRSNEVPEQQNDLVSKVMKFFRRKKPP